MSESENRILGESNEQIDFDTRDENRELANALASQAERLIRIYTLDLETAIYDDNDFIRTLTRLATSSRKSEIQILVQNSSRAVKTGHRIIELARKFTSSIHLHNPPRNMKEYTSAFLLADESGLLFKAHGDSYKGYANFNDKLRNRDLDKIFHEAWERSQPDPEMRRLYI
jgi:hypothetical protein